MNTRSIRRAPRRRAGAAVALLALALALGGCASLSESECSRGDWFAIASNDAYQGRTPDRIRQHDAACGKHGIEVDAQAYDEGYRHGLANFCTPVRGFEMGRAGNAYYRQCPPPAEAEFMPAYDLGGDVRAIDQELAELEKEIEAIRKELRADDLAEEARDAAERRLRYLKSDRDRRERDRDGLLERARRRGYGNVW